MTSEASGELYCGAKQGSPSAGSPLAPAQNQNPDTQTSPQPPLQAALYPTNLSPPPPPGHFFLTRRVYSHSPPWPTTTSRYVLQAFEHPACALLPRVIDCRPFARMQFSGVNTL